MTTLRIEIDRNDGRGFQVRGEAEFPGTVEQIKATAPTYCTQYPHRFFLDGALVHEEPAQAKKRGR